MLKIVKHNIKTKYIKIYILLKYKEIRMDVFLTNKVIVQ